MSRKSNIDGFIPRRPVSRTPVSGSSFAGPASGLERASGRGVIRPEPTAPTGLRQSVGEVSDDPRLSRSDIADSLRDIGNLELDEKPQKTRSSRSERRARVRKVLRWVVWAIITLAVLAGAWVGYKVFIASGHIFKGGVFGLTQHKELKMDENGRSNILVIGTSEDDPGHEGAYLTDSLMVISVNQKNKDAYLVSIPRDLPVEYGMACNAGYQGKINEYFNCVNSDWDSDEAEVERQTETRKFFGEILGLDIQYSAHVNYSVMRDVVSALGTITVNIEGSDGAPGVMDSNFDWKCKGGDPYASQYTMAKICPPNGHFIDYPNGPAVLDAEHALYLAQARGDRMPTYGLSHSNFDREQNQQKIMLAIRDKAMSTGTLTNIGKVTALIDAVGDNLRTNFETAEVRTLMDLASSIPSESIHRLNMLEDGILLGDATPAAGMFDYSGIQRYIRDQLTANPITKEQAHVIILNATGIAGLAQQEANRVEDLGITVDAVDNAPDGLVTSGKNQIYRVADQPKLASFGALSKLYGVATAQVSNPPGVTYYPETDYVIVIGSDTANKR